MRSQAAAIEFLSFSTRGLPPRERDDALRNLQQGFGLTGGGIDKAAKGEVLPARPAIVFRPDLAESTRDRLLVDSL